MKSESRYCKRCQQRESINLNLILDCKNCIKCFKKYIKILELNDFIKRMNEQHNTNVTLIKQTL